MPAEHHRLVEAALHANKNAYAPYSHFMVGCAVLTEHGQLFTGANVENASYGLTICAERAATFTAVSAGHRKFEALAVFAGEPGAAPCGACRQVLSEFMPTHAPIYYLGADGQIAHMTMGELLPAPFARPL